MTSRIIIAIVAIVAAVLSLAAPVAVDAQTPSLQVEVNTIGATRITYSGFTAGVSYYAGGCHHATAHPASCSFDSNGIPTGGDPEGFLECSERLRAANNVNTSGLFGGGGNGVRGILK